MTGGMGAWVVASQRPGLLSMSAAGMPYAVLVVLAAITLPWRTVHTPGMVLDLSMCALAAIWMLALHTLRRPSRRAEHAPVFVFGLIVITWFLVIGDGWFGFFTAVCFGHAHARLRWPWRLAGSSAVAFVAATSQVVGVQGSLPFRVTILVFAVALDSLMPDGLMWLLHDRDEQVAHHQMATAELTASNRRLEAIIEENDALHEQLLLSARESGTLDERRRMAREIHDTLAQGLTGIVTQLQAAEQAADDPARWRRHVSAATRLARDSLTEARRSVHALRPQPLEDGRLSEALAGVAERWTGLHGIPVQVTTTGTARLVRPEVEFALLRAAQEALANVARHAHATRVGLTVSYMENEVALDVRDDGVGFDSTQPPGGQPGHDGFGLVAMRQRIEDLTGTLQVESEPGGGTAISACVPTIRALAGGA
ncbi:MAG TPA: sensor histidine kinase [Trebonia sp.]|nr:sensor histidine kinase [Trebonia sp.]